MRKTLKKKDKMYFIGDGISFDASDLDANLVYKLEREHNIENLDDQKIFARISRKEMIFGKLYYCLVCRAENDSGIFDLELESDELVNIQPEVIERKKARLVDKGTHYCLEDLQ